MTIPDNLTGKKVTDASCVSTGKEKTEFRCMATVKNCKAADIKKGIMKDAESLMQLIMDVSQAKARFYVLLQGSLRFTLMRASTQNFHRWH